MAENMNTIIDINKNTSIRLSCLFSVNVPNKDQSGIKNKCVTKIKN